MYHPRGHSTVISQLLRYRTQVTVHCILENVHHKCPTVRDTETIKAYWHLMGLWICLTERVYLAGGGKTLDR